MIVRRKRDDEIHPDLTPKQEYLVIGIEADDLRILNDEGRPFLYPPELFEVVDASEPVDWVTEHGDDGERYSYPRILDRPGFFEDFFDAQREAITAFWRVVNRQLAKAA